MNVLKCTSCKEEVPEWNMGQTKFGPVCPSCMGEYEDYMCDVEEERRLVKLWDE